MAVDLEMLKDIPGYKAILKSVLKSQIQMLLEQLCSNTGEESIILTASANDGTISHLGTATGKGFLDGREDMKSQFLGYCIKIHHQPKIMEAKVSYPEYNASPKHTVHNATSPKWPRYNPLSRPTNTKSHHNQKKLHDTSPIFQSATFTANNNAPLTSTESDLPFKSELSLESSVGSEPNGFGTSNATDTSNLYATNTNDSQNASFDNLAVKVEPEEDNDLEMFRIELNPSAGFQGNGSQDDGQGRNDPDHSMPMYNNPVENVDDTCQSSLYQLYVDASNISLTSGKHLSGFQCDLCNKVFGQRSDKTRHMRIHTGEKPYVCSVCNACFRLKHHLKSHKVSMHMH
ncbi:early growth response factor homolog 1-like isoform X2 [Mya arenaria]|uniref:early growth response factor homolog 1-like isoform X2 n=1 Tax=Mya arenaria TaxID=6604 RepID=UPI0022E31625|nr:early growth response factor homolog 1-like isoform X2 [Mya arenaria]